MQTPSLRGVGKLNRKSLKSGVQKSWFLPKIDVFGKTVLLAPLVMGRPKLELHRVEEASGYQIHANTEPEGCRKVKSEEFEIGGAKIVFLPKIDVFGKTVLLAPLVMGRPKLELHRVEEAAGYQIHANTEPEGCRKVKSEEFEIGGAKIVFLPKIDDFGKTVLLAPLVMGRPKLELHRVEEAAGYQIHANTEPEGCRKVKSEEFEIGGAKIVFLPKIDVFGKTVLLAPLVMGRPKLELHRVEEAAGYQIHANTEPEGCRKVKSEEFEIGGAKIVFLPKIDVFGKTVLLAPLVTGRPKLELHRVEEAAGYQIHANTEPEGCRKVKSEEFEIGGAKIVVLPKIDVFGKTVLLAPLVMGRPKLELHRVEEAAGYQIHANTEPEGCRKVKSEEFEIGGAKIVFLPKIDVFGKTVLLAPLVMGRPKLELHRVEEAAGYQIHANTEPEGCRKVKSEEFEIGGAKIVFLPKIDDFGKTVLLAPLVMGRPKLELHRVEEAAGYQIHANTEPEGCRKVKSEEFEIGGAKIVFLPKIDVFGKTVLLAPLVMGRPKLELHRVEEAAGYQIHANTEPEGCRKVKSEEFEIGGAKIVFLPKIDVFGKTVLLAPLVMGRPKLELHRVEEAAGYQIHANTEPEGCRKVKSEEFEIGGAKIVVFAKN